MTLGDIVGNATAETPLVVAVAGALLSVALFIGKRAASSMQRQGARLGRLEANLRSETLRRRQVEQCLRELRVPLPYWPDDPAALYVRGPITDRDRDDDDRDDDDADRYTRERPTVPPLDGVGAHHRRRTGAA